MNFGAVKFKKNIFSGWMSNLASAQLVILPVPGEDVIRRFGINLRKKSIQIAANPREANVLLIPGSLPGQLYESAAILYAQMPRPRLIAKLGEGNIHPLPKPDLMITANQSLEQIIPEIRRLLKENYKKDPQSYEPDFINGILKKRSEQQQQGGHQHHHHGNGDNDHSSHEGHEHHKKEHEGHKDHEHHENQHHENDHKNGEHEHHEEHGQKRHGHQDHHQEEHENEHEHKNHEENQHQGHQHHDSGGGHGGHQHGMGFMSMVMMTKDMPRSLDGLAMERNEVYFGPFFPGLPAGLIIKMHLDGDTVIKAEVEKQIIADHWKEVCPSSKRSFPENFGKKNLLDPVTYQLLASSIIYETEKVCAFIYWMEYERMLSHLNWLATFSQTIGNHWIYQQAIYYFQRVQQRKIQDDKLKQFVQKVKKLPLLQKRLERTGEVPKLWLHHTSGPVARSAGIEKDFRTEDPIYQDLDFKPVYTNQNNLWGRLYVRLEEIIQSLSLLRRVEDGSSIPLNEIFKDAKLRTDKLYNQIESPRGYINLQLDTQEDEVTGYQIKSGAFTHKALINEVIKNHELGDALALIASLDINPWEVE